MFRVCGKKWLLRCNTAAILTFSGCLNVSEWFVKLLENVKCFILNNKMALF